MRILKFIKEVMIETKKVVWPTKKDIAVIVAAVVFVVLISGVFFLCVDYMVYGAIDFLLNFKGF